MTPLKPIENLFAVEVPVSATLCSIKNGTYTRWIVVDGRKHCVLNEQGKFRILFTTSNAAEQQAAGVVLCTQPKVRGARVQMAFYKNYEHEFSSFGSAIASLESLLRANNLAPDKNFLLIKRNEQ